MVHEFNGTADITHEGIKKHFVRWKKEPIQSVIELIANGFDAQATRVNVMINFTPLEGIESITVTDNGTGINTRKCSEHFSRFNESLKRGDDNLQGSHGRGRLAFHLLCESATWYTKSNDNDNSKIAIESSSLRDFRVIKLDNTNQHALLSNESNGTCVELNHFIKNLPDIDIIHSKLQNEFGWRLALNNKRKLFVNGHEVTVPSHQLIEKNIEIEGFNFNISFVRWNNKPGVEKSYNYLINSDGQVQNRVLNSFNKKSEFYLSTYTQSEWVDYFDEHCSSLNFSSKLITNSSSPAYKTLQKEIHKTSLEIYEDFQRQQVESQMALFESKGYFPTYKSLSSDEAEWRNNNLKSVVRDLYITEPSLFRSLKIKQAKVLIALLDRLLVSNENDGLIDVLENILELDNEKINKLSSQLSKTSLENVISTIEVLQKRESAVYKLRELMVKHYKDVLETPDLQTIIERNTWLFGEQYAVLGAEEDDFQKIAKELRSYIRGIDELNEDDFETEDLEAGLNIAGVRRQVDLFLARQNVCFDSSNRSYFKCTIIEIKKPSVSLNRKHLEQLKDYARIIAQHTGFSTENMKFELILVGRKISNNDYDIPSAFETAEDKNEPGLAFTLEKGRIKGFVKTWGTIFSEFELSNNYLLTKLKVKRESLEGQTSKSLVNELQTETE